jgi:hypothetical protein
VGICLWSIQVSQTALTRSERTTGVARSPIYVWYLLYLVYCHCTTCVLPLYYMCTTTVLHCTVIVLHVYLQLCSAYSANLSISAQVAIEFCHSAILPFCQSAILPGTLLPWAQCSIQNYFEVAKGRFEVAELAEIPSHGKLFLSTAELLLNV